jgi:acyl-CoA thioester hydrolase
MPMAHAPESGAFSFFYEVPVRFRDLDALGHAHHSLPLIYIEEARAAWWREIVGQHGLDSIDYVLGQISVSFRRRILYPGTVRVGIRVGRVGNSSFTMEYELRSADGDLLATAETVQVMFDYAAGSSKPIPAAIRQRLTVYS